MASNSNSTNNKRGFATMDTDTQRKVASKGGKTSGGNFKNDPEKASKAGKKKTS